MTDRLGAWPPSEVDAVIELWGRTQCETMRREQRGKLDSEIFDVPRRTWVGFECYYEAVAGFLRMLDQLGGTPEVIGRRMKVPGSRPYYLQLFILMSNYLGAREQRVIERGSPPEADSPEAAADLTLVVEYFARAAAAYREDGQLVPAAPRYDQCVLTDEWVERVGALLEPPDRLPEVIRLSARLSLYSFMLHGEQRDGQFEHGPYPGPRGTRLLLREFNDLANDFLPWAERERPLERDNVCIAFACRDVDMRFTIFGGCLTDPIDFMPRVEAVAAFSRVGTELEPLDAGELERLGKRAAELQLELYRQAVGWELIERMRYGRRLYANHLIPFFELAGAADRIPDIGSRFDEIGARVADELARSGELPEVFEYFKELGESPMFSALAGCAK